MPQVFVNIYVGATTFNTSLSQMIFNGLIEIIIFSLLGLRERAQCYKTFLSVIYEFS
jgi:hypothetical protein